VNEFRRAKRRRADATIEIVDTMREQAVGRIGNLSETGMLALTTDGLADDALYQFRFRLADSRGGEHEVEVGAHQLWSEPAQVEGQFWTGFRFIAIGADDAAHLRHWVEDAAAEYV
jgi:hypothetical protein